MGDAGSSTAETDTAIASAPDGSRRVTGWVRNYNSAKGYDFARTLEFEDLGDDGVTDAFFHISQLDADTVEEGARLEFGITENEEGFECDDPKIVAAEETDNDLHPQLRAEKGVYSEREQGFGHQGEDTKVGRQPEASNDDIENFDDDRKFR